MDRTGKYIDGTRQEKSRFGEPECGQTGGKHFLYNFHRLSAPHSILPYTLRFLYFVTISLIILYPQ